MSFDAVDTVNPRECEKGTNRNRVNVNKFKEPIIIQRTGDQARIIVLLYNAKRFMLKSFYAIMQLQ
jgi:hypothetical protein